MEDGNSTNGSRWNTARKNRNHSRFLIRRRVQEEAETKTSCSLSPSSTSCISSPSLRSISSNMYMMNIKNSSQKQQTRGDNGLVNGDRMMTTDFGAEQNDYITVLKKECKVEEDDDDKNEQQQLIKSSLKAISLGSTSYFSLEFFSTQNKLLTEPISTMFFSTYKIQTLCSSRFDQQKKSNHNYSYCHPCNDNIHDQIKQSSVPSATGSFYTNSILSYIQIIQCCTMFEYALLLGEYNIAQSFIKSGGINPCDLMYQYQFQLQCRHEDQNSHGHNYHEDNSDLKKRLERISALVMKKLVINFVPTSLSAYIAKSVYEMRLWSIIMTSTCNDNDASCSTEQKCHVCFQSIPCPKFWSITNESSSDIRNTPNHRPLLMFPLCQHRFCEICLWENVVNNLDDRVEGDVVRCPVCDRCRYQDHGKHDDDSISKTETECLHQNKCQSVMKPCERGEKSMQQFLKLPKDVRELKKLPKKSKKAKNILYRTWSTALQPPTIGKSQDVRTDKFKRYVDINALHHCRSCLEFGVDINVVNEYHQTPLYIACWKNHVQLVELLLDWGANVELKANGNMSILDVAVENGHWEVTKILEGKVSSSSSSSSLCLRKRIQAFRKKDPNIDANRNTITPQMTKLIQDDNHPGNGTFYIDHLLDEGTMTFLDTLFESVPIADATEIKKKKIDKNIPCSLRHYFCDAEGHLCKMIANSLEKVLHKNSNVENGDQNAYVFPHMRFLNYNQKGGELLPHIDLTKIDPMSGRRSTHTFILYLCDCEFGGETAMLKKLSVDGPKAYHEIIEPAVSPRRGRILLFPHACPHQGMKVISTPKILLRGEVLLF